MIGRVTGDSTESIGNALKSIYEKATSNSLEELANIWNTLNDESKEDLALAIAGRYNLSEFLVLMESLSEDK